MMSVIESQARRCCRAVRRWAPGAALLLASVATVCQAAPQDGAAEDASTLPSAKEVRAALLAHIETLNADATRLLPDDAGAALQVGLDGMVLHRCVPVEDEPRSFDCRMDLRLKLSGSGRPETRMVTIRFTRSTGEWLVN